MVDSTAVKADLHFAFRDFTVEGVPASGNYWPLKAAQRAALFQFVDYVQGIGESASAGRRVFATLAERDAWVDRPVGAQSYVEETGLFYRWSDSSWVVFDEPSLDAAARAEDAAIEAEAAAAAFNTLPLTPIITGNVGTGQQVFPNLNGETNRLEIPAGVVLNTRTSQVTVSEAVSIDLSTIASSAKKVYYNTATSGWVVKAYNTALTPGEFPTHNLVAVVRRTEFRSQDSVSMSCPALVNGAPALRDPTIRTYLLAPLFTPLDSVYGTNAVTPFRNLPNFDTASDTFTLFRSTLIGNGPNVAIVLTADKTVVRGSSSAGRIFYDTATDNLVWLNWNIALTPSQAASFILIATLRKANVWQTPPVLSIATPYTIDGVLREDMQVSRRGDSFEGLAHRGWASWAPENTLVAYRRCASLGQMIIEGDIRWTSDDVPVLLHDPTIDRTTGATGGVQISDLTLAAALAYDYANFTQGGILWNTRYPPQALPTFDEVLVLMKKLNLYGYFEIKASFSPTRAKQIVDMIKRRGMYGQVQIHSFWPEHVEALVAEDPRIATGLLTNAMSSANIAQCVAFQTGDNEVSIMPKHDTITEPLVEEAHAAGLRVIAFTVDDPARVVALAAMGVDGVMTDRLNVNQVLRASEAMPA